MKSTQHLVPAVFRKEGAIDYGTLEQTAIVVLKPGDIDDRLLCTAVVTSLPFVARPEKEWPLATARSAGYRPRRLLAIMKTSHVIAGDWDLDLQAPVLDDRFVLADPGNDDPRGVKGMLLDLGDAGLGNLVTWSSDIRGTFL